MLRVIAVQIGVLTATGFHTLVGAGGDRQVVVSFDSAADFERCTWDRFVDTLSEPGAVKLVAGYQIADEIGDRVSSDVELVAGNVKARKWLIAPVRRASGQLVFFGSAVGPECRITCNDIPLHVEGKAVAPGWSCVDIPAGILRRGLNCFEFSAGKDSRISIGTEACILPDRSARSRDGGKTWDKDWIGPGYDGEYLVRLWLDVYPAKGEIVSPVIDPFEGTIPERPEVVGFKPSLEASGSVEILFRSGPKPFYDPDTWSGWEAAPKKTDRYWQWKAVLSSKDGTSTPELRSLKLAFETRCEERGKDVRIVALEPSALRRTSYHFAYEDPALPRLAILRKTYSLDEVVASGKSDLEKLVKLRDWTRRAWDNGWTLGDYQYIPPWDALLILDLKKRNKCLGMCTHYATVFAQCALSLGYTARLTILSHHCVAEVWAPEYAKWVIMDPSPDPGSYKTTHYELNGLPLSGIELHKLLGKKVVEATSTGRKQVDTPPQYEWVGLPLRNNFLSLPEPAEPEHGQDHYHYNGYLWWSDDARPALHQFALHSYRQDDFLWDVNRVRIHLTEVVDHSADLPQASETTGGTVAVRVVLESETPGLDSYLRRTPQGWEKCPDHFDWKLVRGTNVLEVKVRNKLGVEGPASRAAVRYSDSL